MKKLLLALLLTTPCFAASEYVVEVAHNDEFFIINGEKFSAKTYCMHLNQGDRVIFTDGSPSGLSISATVYDLNTKEECDLWSE
jgi:hypothetical protein